MCIWNNSYLRHFFSRVDSYSSYNDIINDITVTAILFSSLCFQPPSQSLNKITTSSNQRLGECVRPKMESQVVAKEQGCWQTMQFNMPQMER